MRDTVFPIENDGSSVALLVYQSLGARLDIFDLYASDIRKISLPQVRKAE